MPVDDAARRRSATSVTGLLVAGLEADGGAGRDVESHAKGGAAVEVQGAVDLEEVGVGADLDRPVAGVGDFELKGAASGVQLDVAGLDDVEGGAIHGSGPPGGVAFGRVGQGVWSRV